MANRLSPAAMSTSSEMQMHNNRNIRAPCPSAFKPTPSQGHYPQFDQERVYAALRMLTTNGTPPTVVKHLISMRPECIRECMFLLQQVQDGVDIGWVDDVTQSLQDLDQAEAAPYDNQEEQYQVSRCTSKQSRYSHLSGTTFASNGNLRPLTQPATSAVSIQEEPYLDNGSNFHIYDTSIEQIFGQPTPSPYQGAPLLNSGDADLSTFSTTSWLDDAAAHTPMAFLDDSVGRETEHELVPIRSFESYHSQDYLDTASCQDGPTTTWRKREQLVDCGAASLQPPKSHDSSQPVQSHRVLPNARNSQFVDYKHPPPSKSGYRSPCPLCDKAFVSPKEFVLHMKAHDQQIEFICLHFIQSRHGARICHFRTWRRAQMARHHTDHHRQCNVLSVSAKGTHPCWQENHDPHPKRVWGCWFCTCATYSVDLWVRHHMEHHKGFSRRRKSVTSLIKSLLSQDLLRDLWQTEIDQLEESTGRTYDLRWSDEPNDPERDELIRDLESGFWGRHDFYTDLGARQGIVKTAMDATGATRVVLDLPFHTENNRVKRRPTSPPPGTKPRRTRSFYQALSLRTSRSKPNLKQQAPAPSDQSYQTEISRPVTSHHAGMTSSRGHRDGHATSRHNLRPPVGAAHEDQSHMLPY